MVVIICIVFRVLLNFRMRHGGFRSIGIPTTRATRCSLVPHLLAPTLTLRALLQWSGHSYDGVVHFAQSLPTPTDLDNYTIQTNQPTNHMDIRRPLSPGYSLHTYRDFPQPVRYRLFNR